MALSFLTTLNSPTLVGTPIAPTATAGTNTTQIATTAFVQTAATSKLNIAGGTLTGILVAQNNTSYTTKQVRNIFISTSDPSGGSNGDIWIKYIN